MFRLSVSVTFVCAGFAGGMATLREGRSYGLSGKLSRDRNVSVFYVKLTDSAAKAIDGFRNDKVTFLCLFDSSGFDQSFVLVLD